MVLSAAQPMPAAASAPTLSSTDVHPRVIAAPTPAKFRPCAGPPLCRGDDLGAVGVAAHHVVVVGTAGDDLVSPEVQVVDVVVDEGARGDRRGGSAVTMGSRAAIVLAMSNLRRSHLMTASVGQGMRASPAPRPWRRQRSPRRQSMSRSSTSPRRRQAGSRSQRRPRWRPRCRPPPELPPRRLDWRRDCPPTRPPTRTPGKIGMLTNSPMLLASHRVVGPIHLRQQPGTGFTPTDRVLPASVVGGAAHRRRRGSFTRGGGRVDDPGAISG